MENPNALSNPTPNRWWDIPAALMLLTAFLLASLRLVSTRWVAELPLVHLMVLVGIVAGLALGYSRFSGRVVFFFASVYGLFLLGWRFGAVYTRGDLWSERMLTLLERINVSLYNLFNQEAVTDPMMFVLGMAVLFWVVSLAAGVTLSRSGSAWGAVLPMGAVLFVIHYFDRYFPARAWQVGAFIFLMLLMVARMFFVRLQHRWEATRTHLPPYVGIDLLRTTLFAALAIMVLAWTAPAMAAAIPPVRQAWTTLARPYYEARDSLSNAFAALNNPVRVAEDYFGNSLSLGRGNTLADTEVLSVIAPPKPNPSIRYYWRARAYADLNNNVWTEPLAQDSRVGPTEFDLLLPALSYREEMSFLISPRQPVFTIYTVSETTGVSRPANAKYAENPDGTADLLGLQARQAIAPGETYEIQAQVLNATAADLRAAGTDYPAWITERYLQLPPSITQRTRDLAQSLAEGQETPYDITIAVTNYLRANIEYVEQIDPPPNNQNTIDWFLFDYQKGFCNYYATAQIVLLRSLGIPARMVVGYAQGAFDANTNTYTVRQLDAHAWPEVYFPGIGWVEFEPTVSQQPIQRPSGEPLDSSGGAGSLDDTLPQPDDLPENSGTPSPTLSPEELDLNEAPLAEAPSTDPPWAAVFGVIVGVPLAILAALLAFQANRQRARRLVEQRLVLLPVWIERLFVRVGLPAPGFIRHWAYRATLPPTAKAYEQINHSLARLGKPAEAHLTPGERAYRLTRLLPQAADDIQTLVNQYHRLIYGAAEVNPEAARTAARLLRRHTWQAYTRKLLARA